MGQTPQQNQQPVTPAPAPAPSNNGPTGVPLELLQEAVGQKKWSIGDLFGGVFWAAIFAAVAYFVLRIPQVQEWVGRLLPDDAKAWINSKLGDKYFPGAAEALLKTVSPDDLSKKLTDHAKLDPATATSVAKVITDNRDAYIGAVKAANGKVTLDTMSNEKTITQLLTTQPALVSQLIAALPPRTANAGKPDGMTQKILASVNSIVADRAQFDALMMKPESRAMAMQAVAYAAPVKLDAAKLNAFVTAAGLDANGKPTDGFYQAITGVMASTASGDRIGTANALVGFMSLPETSSHKKELLELVRSIQTDDPKLQAMLTPLKSEQNLVATMAMAKALQGERATQLLTAMNSGNGMRDILPIVNSDPAVKSALIQFAHDADLKQFPADVQSGLALLNGPAAARDKALKAAEQISKQDIPAEVLSPANFKGTDGKFSGGKLVDFLMDDTKRAYFRPRPGFERPLQSVAAILAVAPTSTAEEKQAIAFITTTGNRFGVADAQVNLSATMLFIDKIKAAAASGGPDAEHRTQRIMRGLIGSLTHEPKALEGLGAADITAFFRDPRNRAAFVEFATTLDARNLPPQQRDMLNVLKHDHGKGASDIANALTDDAAAQAFLKAMLDHAANKKAAPKTGLAKTMDDAKLQLAQPVVKEALDEIRALQAIAARDYTTVPRAQAPAQRAKH